MKRQYVIPDLLASLTAHALFADGPRSQAAAMPAAGGPSAMQRLTRWFKRAPEAVTVSPAPSATARHTLTDDWAGGWYARTRLLQAATLAQYPAGGTSTPATGEPTSLGVPPAVRKAAS